MMIISWYLLSLRLQLLKADWSEGEFCMWYSREPSFDERFLLFAHCLYSLKGRLEEVRSLHVVFSLEKRHQEAFSHTSFIQQLQIGQ